MDEWDDWGTGGYEWTPDSDYFGGNEFEMGAPDLSSSDLYLPDAYDFSGNELAPYENPYFDLGQQLSDAGMLPYDQYGTLPDLSALQDIYGGNLDQLPTGGFGVDPNITLEPQSFDSSNPISFLNAAAGDGTVSQAGDLTSFATSEGNLDLDPVQAERYAEVLRTTGDPALAKAEALGQGIRGYATANPGYAGYRSTVPGEANFAGGGGAEVHDIGGYKPGILGLGSERSMGVKESPYGLESGPLTSKGYMGAGIAESNPGMGLMIPGAPNRANSLSDLQLLDEDPEGTMTAWAKNEYVPWERYAEANNYDPYDLGVDNRYNIPNLRMAGSGGTAGGGQGTTLNPASRATPTSEKSNNTQGKGAPQQKDASGNLTKAQTALNTASMLAQIAAALRGNKDRPELSDEEKYGKGANAWRVSRAAGSGRRNMAMGGPILPAAVSPLGLIRQQMSRGGQADGVPINASGGEYMVPADAVAHLGGGTTEAGAAQLDRMVQNARRHRNSGRSGLPPAPRSPEAYMKGNR